jgi:hypothetical protein
MTAGTNEQCNVHQLDRRKIEILLKSGTTVMISIHGPQ